MSGITYVNSALHALQSVSMVTNQVKVCQHQEMMSGAP